MCVTASEDISFLCTPLMSDSRIRSNALLYTSRSRSKVIQEKHLCSWRPISVQCSLFISDPISNFPSPYYILYNITYIIILWYQWPVFLYIYIYWLYLNRSTCTKKSRSIRGNNDTINCYYIITVIVIEMCTPMALYPPTIKTSKHVRHVDTAI